MASPQRAGGLAVKERTPARSLPKMRKAKVFPPEYNVLRRLYAAVVVQAVYDLEDGSTDALDRLTAKWFLRRDAGFIADEFELDEGKLLQFVKERGGWY